jgi:glycogen synthase
VQHPPAFAGSLISVPNWALSSYFQDILHCHDWSSAPAAWMYWEKYHSNGMPNPRVVFTIHNLEFGVAQIGRAMAAANKATTVGAKGDSSVGMAQQEAM